MATTLNLTKSGRLETLTPLSGAFALPANAVDVLDQIVSAGTEEEAAMGLFKDHQLQALVLRCDQDARAQFLGVRYDLVDSVAGPPGVLSVAADLTEILFPGDFARIEGTVGNDGVFLVDTVAFAADTTITFANGQHLAGGEGAVGTVARVCSHQVTTMHYAVITDNVNGTITFTGDLSDKFAAGDYLAIKNSTANDGLWEIRSVDYAAPTTSIVVNVAPGGAAGLPAANNDGSFVLVRSAIELPANEVFLWDHESGAYNPFFPIGGEPDDILPMSIHYSAARGDVDHCMVIVPGTTNGQFDGLVAKNPELP